MNILISTTRQWNPGDEFIMLGCINVLKRYFGDFNPIIFNRNPQIRRTSKAGKLKMLDKLFFSGKIAPFLDNSYKDDCKTPVIDLVVFAGSPEWRGKRLTPLYDLIERKNLPVIFLGIGSNRHFSFTPEHFTCSEMKVLNKAKLLTCRDQLVEEGLKDISPVRLTCPAMLAAPNNRERSNVRKVALIYATDKAVKHNNISQETFVYQQNLYLNLIEYFRSENIEYEFVAHYIDELSFFDDDYPNEVIRYSYDAKDYIDIYDQFDLVIGPRIHGVGLSASLGVPGICLAHDKRGATAKGFHANIIQVGEEIDIALDKVKDRITKVAEYSKSLIEKKEELSNEYGKLVVKAFAHE